MENHHSGEATRGLRESPLYTSVGVFIFCFNEIYYDYTTVPERNTVYNLLYVVVMQTTFLANIKHLYNICLRRWSNIGPTRVIHFFVLTVWPLMDQLRIFCKNRPLHRHRGWSIAIYIFNVTYFNPLTAGVTYIRVFIFY